MQQIKSIYIFSLDGMGAKNVEFFTLDFNEKRRRENRLYMEGGNLFRTFFGYTCSICKCNGEKWREVNQFSYFEVF